MRLVLDTNTLLSAFLFSGNEAKLLEKIICGEVHAFISEDILEEFDRILDKPKLKRMLESESTTKSSIESILFLEFLLMFPKERISACRDPADDMILECAVEAKADYIISGDEDLLILGEFRGIKIVRTKEILDILN